MAKGDFGGECNRTVCKHLNANWYNSSTRKYYCIECALLINRENNQELCVKENNEPTEPTSV